MERIDLPEPARTLLRRVKAALDEWVTPICPEEAPWRIGGGTLLAARWGHRLSTDIDIFLDERSGLGALNPRRDMGFTEAMEDAGAEKLSVEDRSLKYQFRAGRVELAQLDPRPKVGHEIALVEGWRIPALRNTQILAGKLGGRGLRSPARDIFDIAVAGLKDPDALEEAVNLLGRDSIREITTKWEAGTANYRTDATENLQITDSSLKDLLHDAPAMAVEAVNASVYQGTRITVGGAKPRLELKSERARTRMVEIEAASAEQDLEKHGLLPLIRDTVVDPKKVGNAIREVSNAQSVQRDAWDSAFEAAISRGEAPSGPKPQEAAIRNALFHGWNDARRPAPGANRNGAVTASDEQDRKAREAWTRLRDRALEATFRETVWQDGWQPAIDRGMREGGRQAEGGGRQVASGSALCVAPGAGER